MRNNDLKKKQKFKATYSLILLVICIIVKCRCNIKKTKQNKRIDTLVLNTAESAYKTQLCHHSLLRL